ncbi:hypothetical protein LX99_00003 [Mucilaginibacter oryzae]|uniref:Uncharacterized protein n=1 Tax=Mucilaginibacter oryzae TaxID=468058 RepID=A0A316HGD5_9SPHI|nr:hypothetical protein LX99_00003 [Mucilaginibacter oryzae]
MVLQITDIFIGSFSNGENGRALKDRQQVLAMLGRSQKFTI